MTPFGRTFDAILHKDERSRNFGVMERRAPTPVTRTVHRYPTIRTDQGQEGHCVGFGWGLELAGDPVRVSGVDDAFSHGLFYKAQEIDRNRHNLHFSDGATVIAGAKAVQELGYMERYEWAFGIDQVVQALMTGPVVLGIEWRDGMYETNSKGLVDIQGTPVGGHCITAFGFIPGMRFGLGKKYDVIPWVNSWGLGYGKRGVGYIKVEDLDTLLRLDGEACVPVHRQQRRR